LVNPAAERQTGRESENIFFLNFFLSIIQHPEVFIEKSHFLNTLSFLRILAVVLHRKRKRGMVGCGWACLATVAFTAHGHDGVCYKEENILCAGPLLSSSKRKARRQQHFANVGRLFFPAAVMVSLYDSSSFFSVALRPSSKLYRGDFSLG
jgi:hypothetical protein